MMIDKKLSKGLILVVVLAAFQAILRLYFSLATSGMLGSQAMNDVHNMIGQPMSDDFWVMNTIMFGIIGIVGLAAAIGLLVGTGWGLYGTIGISAVTIVFDVWAMIAVQGTAAFGLVLPIVFIIYLVARRGSLLEMRSDEGAGGVRY